MLVEANTAFGFVDVNGNCIAESSVQTKAHNSAADLFARLHPEIEKIYASISERLFVKGIGVGAPNAN